MRAPGGATVALAAMLWVVATAGPSAAQSQDGARVVVTAVDLIAAAPVPESLVRRAIGEEASPERLARAREDLVALYRR